MAILYPNHESFAVYGILCTMKLAIVVSSIANFTLKQVVNSLDVIVKPCRYPVNQQKFDLCVLPVA